jgi:branched-chain amino acid transport system substrate-binding protein
MKRTLAWKSFQILFVASVVSLLVSTAATAGSTRRAASNNLTLGAGFPLSGPDAGLAVPIIQGLKLAVKHANAGFFGKVAGKVAIKIQDDQDKPEIGATVARKFCGDKSINAVIGHFASIVSLGTEAIYARCGPMTEISPSSSNDTLTQKGFKNFYRLSATNSEQSLLGAGWIKKRLPAVKTIVTIDANDVTTVQIANQFKAATKAKGISTLSQEHITSGATDFRGVLTKMIGEKPDLIYLSLFVNDGALVVKQARELGYKGVLFGIDAIATSQLVDLAGPSSEGVYFTNLGLDPTKLRSARPFVKAFRAAYKSDPPAYAANAYDALKVVVKAWQKIGTNDRAKLATAVRSVQFVGTSGLVAFDKTGEQKQPGIGIYQIKQGKVAYVGAGVK